MSAGEGDPIDLLGLTVDRVQSGFANGAFACESLVQACLDHIAAVNPRLNALIMLNPEALADARAVDRRRAAGEALGLLASVPVVVKDAMDMAGLPTTGGCASLSSRMGRINLMPAFDAPVVARLRAAGSIILGKTNIPILSHSGSHANDSWAGPTLNAAAPDLLPGGSSAGTASAVASGMAVLGLAEETGGSIQNPAAAHGLVGIKPTFGLVPNTGVLPLSGLRDVVGPIARTVRDAALALDVLAGFTLEDPKTVAGVGHRPPGGYAAGLSRDALRGKRIGLYGPGWRNDALSAETAALYKRAQRELAALGAVLVEDPFAGSGFADLRRPLPPIGLFDVRGLESMPYDVQNYLQRLGPGAAIKSFAQFEAATAREDAFGPAGVLGYMPDVPGFTACRADPARPPDLSTFIAAREAYLSLFTQIFQAARLDALVFPQRRTDLGLLHGDDVILETTVDEINIAGLPGVTVPSGHHASGAPFGLIAVGPMWSEAALLGVAYAYEGRSANNAPHWTSESV